MKFENAEIPCGAKIIIYNQWLTTPGKIYIVKWPQKRTPTPFDHTDDDVWWVYYVNDAGVTDSVRCRQCEVVE